MRHPRTPAERVSWASPLLAGEGEDGVVTALSRASGASRPTRYAWREGARAAGTALFAPGRAPVPPPPAVARAVLTRLVAGHASIRGIQTCLRERWGQRLRLATIVAVIAEAEARALAWLAAHVPPPPRPLALDELFGNAHHHASLSAVDAPSGAVWAAVGPVAPEADSWTLVRWDLQERGLRWPRLIHDGGPAAGSAAARVDPGGVPGRDVGHALARGAAVQGRRDRARAAAPARLTRPPGDEAAVAAGQRPRHRPPDTPAAVQAEEVARLARTAAAGRDLTGEVRHLLGVVVPAGGRRRDGAARRAEVAAALARRAEVGERAPAAVQREIAGQQPHLREARPGLLAFADGLDPVQRDRAALLGEPGVALVGWAWRHRDVLGPTPAARPAGLPPSGRPAARGLLAAWDGAVRASSLVETGHSLRRPHLAVQRTRSPGFLAVLAVWHNHRVLPRGLHRGHNPWHRSGLADAPTDWLSVLGYPPASPASQAVRPRHAPPEEERLVA